MEISLWFGMETYFMHGPHTSECAVFFRSGFCPSARVHNASSLSFQTFCHGSACKTGRTVSGQEEIEETSEGGEETVIRMFDQTAEGLQRIGRLSSSPFQGSAEDSQSSPNFVPWQSLALTGLLGFSGCDLRGLQPKSGSVLRRFCGACVGHREQIVPDRTKTENLPH